VNIMDYLTAFMLFFLILFCIKGLITQITPKKEPPRRKVNDLCIDLFIQHYKDSVQIATNKIAPLLLELDELGYDDEAYFHDTLEIVGDILGGKLLHEMKILAQETGVKYEDILRLFVRRIAE